MTVSKILRPLRFVYLLLMVSPLLYVVPTVVHVFRTPRPAIGLTQYDSHAAYFADLLFGPPWDIKLRLYTSLVLFLLVCGIGYGALKRALPRKKLALLLAFCLLALAVCHPLLWGIVTMDLLADVLGIHLTMPAATYSQYGLAPNFGAELVWGLVQPQNLVILGTAALLTLLLIQKRPA